MSKDWDYAKLVENASKNGGPQKWLQTIKTNSYTKGATDMKNAIVIPVLAAGVGIGVLGVKATEYIIKWVRENKEKKLITEKEAIQAEKFLIEELEESIQEIENEEKLEKGGVNMNNLENMMHLLKNAKSSDNTNSETPEETVVLLEKAIENLPELEKRVIRMRYIPENADTYESLAAEFNVSVEDVEAAHANALRLLRN